MRPNAQLLKRARVAREPTVFSRLLAYPFHRSLPLGFLQALHDEASFCATVTIGILTNILLKLEVMFIISISKMRFN
ncbi:MAG: hypothetical protein ABSC65_06035 [Acidobacteriaceae bacterium]|jgi:hypothetical protein